MSKMKNEKQLIVVEEENEMALTNLVNETLQETTFDYSDVTPEDKDTLVRIKLRKGVIIHNTIVEIGGDLKEAQAIYSHNGSGKFMRWVEEEYGMSFTTADRYMRAYDVLVQNDSGKILSLGVATNLQQLGVQKLSSLSKLTPEQQQQVIENAPLEEMNKKQVEELTKRVKETQEYSDELVEEIKKKDQKNKEQQKQKDKEIESLKAKVQELESKKEQSVEPEVVEKIVEVEKVVEKEVIPESVQSELDELKAEKERLEKENSEKTDFINEQRKEINKHKEAWDSLNLEKEVWQESKSIDINFGALLAFIRNFLDCTAGYTFLKGQYQDISEKNRKTLLNAINRVEDWCLLMRQAVNGDFDHLGKNIIVESEN